MLKKLILIVLVVAGCGPGVTSAPSGHYADGIPEGATIISISKTNRAYKYEDCLVVEQFRGGSWEATTVDCD